MSAWLLGRRDDTRDALIAAALDEPQRALAAWRRLVESGIHDPDNVAARWLPLVALNIKSLVPDAQSRADLERAAREAWAYNVRHLCATRPVLSQLRANGLDVVLLKGAALGATVYPHPGARLLGDIDILVRPHLWATACDLLTGLGWESRTSAEAPESTVHAKSFANRSGTMVDLHRYVLPECVWEGADERAWTRIEPVAAHSVDVLVLGPADQLLHTCVHGIGWSRVHASLWIADAVFLIRAAGHRLSWDVVVEEARQRELSVQVGECLELVRHLGHVDVPRWTLEALRRDRSILQAVECRSKVRPVLGPGGLLTYALAWRRRRRHGPIGLLEYFAGVTGAGSRRGLVAWLVRQVRRRRWGLLHDPRRDGRSKRPVTERER